MIIIDLLPDKPINLDERSLDVGGSFYAPNGVAQPYSPLPLRWVFDQLIRYPHAVMLDVGASSGCFSLLSKHHPSLEVWAFEPVGLTNRILSENVYLNGLMDKVHVSQCAVSDYNGTGVMHIISAVGGLGVSLLDGVPRAEKVYDDVAVEVVSLDVFCALRDIRPTVLKIDTEGGELMVLKGAKHTIEMYKPFILCEYAQSNADQYGYRSREIIEFLEDMGYVWSNPESIDIWATPIGWEVIHNQNVQGVT